jgi:radical SAM family uncharacterized protein
VKEIFDNLISVHKPARYIGEEWNIVKKDWNKTELKILLSYPDIYEIGMSNQGLLLLYEFLNFQQEILAERCFAPWLDFEKYLRDKNFPLFSLETKTPLNQFDLIGFTLQHELNYTNILTILDLGGLKIWQKERGENHPLIVGGGPCTLNPEPVADFFDFFIVGEVEDIILTVLEKVKEWKRKKISRQKLLEELSGFDCVYVPCLYTTSKNKWGYLIPEIDRKINKAYVKDLNSIIYPVRPVVPYIQTVHDRINLEIMRGCPRNCRFCQARIYYSPWRVRKPEVITRMAVEGYKNTGYEEMCLSSLSSGDYPYLEQLISQLQTIFSDRHVFLSLPSLWGSEKIIKILEKFLDSKRPGLTFAPEVSSIRMKKLISKYVQEEKMVQIIDFALNHGWKQVKLYYMLGLPGLGLEDLYELPEFIYTILNLNTKRKPRVKLSFATFIPKPHTPLQWAGFAAREQVEEQIAYLRKRLKHPRIEWEFRDYEFSLLESILARGDRSISEVIYNAWLNGARFDSWTKEFNPHIWYNAFGQVGINYKDFVEAKLERDVIFPWEHIYAGMDKGKIWDGFTKALKNGGVK